MIKKTVVALSFLFLPIYSAPEKLKITPDLVESYIEHEILKEQDQRIERMVWKAAIISSAITGGIGLVTGIAIAFWMNRS